MSEYKIIIPFLKLIGIVILIGFLIGLFIAGIYILIICL